MWHDADARTFGHQVIKDQDLTFHTDWINQGRSWTSRLKLLSINRTKTGHSEGKRYSFIFYFALQVTFLTYFYFLFLRTPLLR